MPDKKNRTDFRVFFGKEHQNEQIQKPRDSHLEIRVGYRRRRDGCSVQLQHVRGASGHRRSPACCRPVFKRRIQQLRPLALQRLGSLAGVKMVARGRRKQGGERHRARGRSDLRPWLTQSLRVDSLGPLHSFLLGLHNSKDDNQAYVGFGNSAFC